MEIVEKDDKSEVKLIPTNQDGLGRNVRQSTEFDDLDRGWSWMVLLASFGTFLVLGGNMYTSSIAQTILLERFNRSISLTSWAGALQSGLIASGGPVSSYVVDRYSCRVALLVAGVLFSTAHFCTAFAGSIYTAILTYGLVGGAGGAIGYIANLLVIGFNFKEKRNIALGISSSGVGVGILIFAPLMEMAKSFYGNTGFFIITSCVCLHLIVFGVMCFPSRLEIHTQLQRKKEIKQRKHTTDQSLLDRFRSSFYVALLKKKAVIFLSVNKFLHCFGTFVILVHLSSYLLEEGYPVSRVASILSVVGVTSIIGRILIGLLASLKWTNPLALYTASELIFTIATLLFPLCSRTFVGQMAYGVLLGLLFGNGYVLITSINIQYVGMVYVSAASGFEFFLCGIGSILGPVFAGFIVDNGGTYKHAFIVGGVTIGLATLAAAVVLCLPKAETDNSINLNGVVENCETKESGND